MHKPLIYLLSLLILLPNCTKRSIYFNAPAAQFKHEFSRLDSCVIGLYMKDIINDSSVCPDLVVLSDSDDSLLVQVNDCQYISTDTTYSIGCKLEHDSNSMQWNIFDLNGNLMEVRRYHYDRLYQLFRTVRDTIRLQYVDLGVRF